MAAAGSPRSFHVNPSTLSSKFNHGRRTVRSRVGEGGQVNEGGRNEESLHRANDCRQERAQGRDQVVTRSVMAEGEKVSPPRTSLLAFAIQLCFGLGGTAQ